MAMPKKWWQCNSGCLQEVIFISLPRETLRVKPSQASELLQERAVTSVTAGKLLLLSHQAFSIQDRNFLSNWITSICCSGQESLSDRDIRQMASESPDLPLSTTLTQILYRLNTFTQTYLRIKCVHSQDLIQPGLLTDAFFLKKKHCYLCACPSIINLNFTRWMRCIRYYLQSSFLSYPGRTE